MTRKHKHLTLDERYMIRNLIERNQSFKSIGKTIGRDCTTVSKEVRNRISFEQTGSYGKPYNPCLHRNTCDFRQVCDNCTSKRKNSFCRYCKNCFSNCSSFVKEQCLFLQKPPYVCNGCTEKTHCVLEKQVYSPILADREYREMLSESRTGISLSEAEVTRLDKIISPLLIKGQSLHHICVNNRDSIMVSKNTLYRLVASNLLTARNIDLPRQVRYRKRRKAKEFKVDKACRIGRTYEDFLVFINKNPQLPIVEIDSVEGTKGGKVLLTIHFVKAEFMLAFIREANDSQSVIEIFDELYLEMKPEIFTNMMPIILCDNGSEFSNPKAIEFDKQGNRRTHLFYCDPASPHQRGSSERNHGFIREFIPKGTCMNQYVQEEITHMMNHINSYCRDSLGDKCAYDTIAFFYGEEVLKTLGSIKICANEVTLKPSIFKEVSKDV